MGRAGGRGGGGGSRGGSFGGSRGGSFGGGGRSRSSSSRSSSSRSSSYRGSSYSSRPRTSGGWSGGFFGVPRTTGPIIINNSGNNNNRGYGGSQNNRPSNQPNNQQNNQQNSNSGCIHIFLITVMVISLVVTMFFAVAVVSAKNSQRTKLNADIDKTGYYTDELGWIDNPSVLIDGMEYFYEKTGVQPYLYITDNVGGDFYDMAEEFANSMYDGLFTDEAHLLVVFHEKDDWYNTYCLAGSVADTVIDSEARMILLDELDDNYYNSSLDDNEFFSKSFENAADEIMKKPPSYTATVVVPLLIFAFALVYEVYLRKKEKQAKRDKELEEMLEKPLKTFGSTEAEELAKKYETDDKSKAADTAAENLSEEKEMHTVCKNCGSKELAGNNFCRQCGNKMN